MAEEQLGYPVAIDPLPVEPHSGSQDVVEVIAAHADQGSPHWYLSSDRRPRRDPRLLSVLDDTKVPLVLCCWIALHRILERCGPCRGPVLLVEDLRLPPSSRFASFMDPIEPAPSDRPLCGGRALMDALARERVFPPDLPGAGGAGARARAIGNVYTAFRVHGLHAQLSEAWRPIGVGAGYENRSRWVFSLDPDED